MLTVRVIDRTNEQDLRLPNDAFELIGRIVPSCANGKWSYKEELWPKEECSSMIFPDEDYTLDGLGENTVSLAAYDGDVCVGLAVYMKEMFRYLYLSDLKVSAAYRGKGVGTALIKAAEELLVKAPLVGIYTIGQDNNLRACRFYLKNGFEIGGFNNRGYDGTSQEGKADIYFYKRIG